MSCVRQESAQLRQIAPDIHDAVLALGQLAGKAGFDKQIAAASQAKA